MTRRHTRSAITLAALATLLGCERARDPVVGPDLSTLTVSDVSGAVPLQGIAGLPLAAAPAVQVTDADGDAVPNVGVLFTPRAGSGETFHTYVLTDSLGIASSMGWRLGPLLGTQVLDVQVFAPGGIAALEISAEAAGGPATSLLLSTYTLLLDVAETGPAITVTARDAAGSAASLPAPPTFTSLATSVATVDGSGVVTAVAPGNATVRVASGTLVRDLEVRVLPPSTSVVAQRSALTGYFVVLDNDELWFASSNMGPLRARLPREVFTPLEHESFNRFEQVPGERFVYASVLAPGSTTFGAIVELEIEPTGFGRRLLGEVGVVMDMALDPVDNIVVVGTGDGRVVRLHRQTGEQAATTLPAASTHGVFAHPTDQRLYATASNGLLYEIDGSSMLVTRTLALGQIPRRMIWLPRTSQILVLRDDGSTLVIDPATLSIVQTLGSAGRARSAAVSPDGATLVIAQLAPFPLPGGVRFFDAETFVETRNEVVLNPTLVRFNRSGELVLIGAAAQPAFQVIRK